MGSAWTVAVVDFSRRPCSLSVFFQFIQLVEIFAGIIFSILVQMQGFKGIESSHFQAVGDCLLKECHVCCRNGICFANDGHNSRFALQRTKHLYVEVFI